MSFPFYSRLVTSSGSGQRNRLKTPDKDHSSTTISAKQVGSLNRSRATPISQQISPILDRNVKRDSSGGALKRRIPFLGKRRKSIAVLRATDEFSAWDKRQTFIPMSNPSETKYASNNARYVPNFSSVANVSPPRSKTPELPPLNVSSLTLGSLATYITPMKNHPYSQAGINLSPSRRSNHEEYPDTRRSARHPLSTTSTKDNQNSGYQNTEMKTRSTFLSRVAPTLNMRRSSADIKGSAAPISGINGRSMHIQPLVYAAPAKESPTPRSRIAPSITVTVPNQQPLPNDQDLFLAPRVAPSPPDDRYSTPIVKSNIITQPHQGMLKNRDSKDNTTISKANRRHAIQISRPTGDFGKMDNNGPLRSASAQNQHNQRVLEITDCNIQKEQFDNLNEQNKKAEHRHTLRNPGMVRIGRSEVTLSVANELQAGLGIEVGDSDSDEDESFYSQEQLEESVPATVTQAVQNRARSATLPEATSNFQGVKANTNEVGVANSEAMAEIENNYSKSWRRSLTRFTTPSQSDNGANKLKKRPSKTSMGFLSRSVSSLNLKSNRPLGSRLSKPNQSDGKNDYVSVSQTNSENRDKRVFASVPNAKVSTGDISRNVSPPSAMPSLSTMPTIPSVSGSVASFGRSNQYPSFNNNARGNLSAVTSNRPVYLPPPSTSPKRKDAANVAQTTTTNASPNTSPSKRSQTTTRVTYEELLNSNKSQTARFDQLAGYLLKVIQRHQTEKTSYDNRIEVLEGELHNREREIKGLRWLVTNATTRTNSMSPPLDGAARVESLQQFLASPSDFCDPDETPRPTKVMADGTDTSGEFNGLHIKEKALVRKPRLSRSNTMPNLRDSGSSNKGLNDEFPGLGLEFPMPGPLSLPSIASTMIFSTSSTSASNPGLTTANTMSSGISSAGHANQTVVVSQSLPAYHAQHNNNGRRPERRSLHSAPRPPPSAHVPDEVAASLAYTRNLNMGRPPSIEQVITKVMERESIDLDEMFDEMIQGIKSTPDLDD